MTQRAKIGVETIKKLAPNTIVWDTKTTGFHVRRQKGDARVYYVFYRTKDGRQRFSKIGRHGAPWTPEMAREEALRILVKVKDGGDPGGEKAADRMAATVAQLCDDYLEEATTGRLLTRRRAPKKASTLLVDKGNIEHHIKPLLGALKASAVTRRDIERFRDSVSEGETKATVRTRKKVVRRVRGGRGAATRILGLLGAIFAFAVTRNLRPDNPVRGVTRHADNHRTRRASEAEYAALGEALRDMRDAVWPAAVSAVHFVALTGWRRGELLALKWSEVDLAGRTARLGDTKTGASMRPLSHAACAVLRTIDRTGDLVFPASRGSDQPMTGFHKIWLKIACRAKLPPDVTAHVLRHSFASIAADLDYSELTIAALIGHKKGSVTSRYSHHSDPVLLAAADKVAARIEQAMGFAQAAGEVVAFPQRGA
jgi:integrase